MMRKCSNTCSTLSMKQALYIGLLRNAAWRDAGYVVDTDTASITKHSAQCPRHTVNEAPRPPEHGGGGFEFL